MRNPRDPESEGELPHEAAPAVGVVPEGIQAVALELMVEGVGRQGGDPLRERRVGDDLVAAEVVASSSGRVTIWASPAAQKEARGAWGIPCSAAPRYRRPPACAARSSGRSSRS